MCNTRLWFFPSVISSVLPLFLLFFQYSDVFVGTPLVGASGVWSRWPGLRRVYSTARPPNPDFGSVDGRCLIPFSQEW